jgi:putative tryptophan/tyrosine transport system substrate-binding protein
VSTRRAIVLGAAAASTFGALAQVPPGSSKIGYLHINSVAFDHPTLAALRAQWAPLGYMEGRNVLLRSAGGDASRLPALVQELIDQGVSALIVVGAIAVRIAAQATKTVPIVAIDLETDPVRAGYAASFARPGGNVTGLFLDQPSIAGKWIDLLREVAADLERLVILWDASTGADQLEIAKAACRTRGFEAVVLELGRITSFDEALRPLAGRPRAGIVQLSSPGFTASATRFAEAAIKHRLPSISFLRNYAQLGVLMTYGPVQGSYFGQAATYADRIVKGEKPGELPIQGPDRFEFVINRRTARALGLAIPPAVLLRADEVIQ